MPLAGVGCQAVVATPVAGADGSVALLKRVTPALPALTAERVTWLKPTGLSDF